MVGAFRWPTRPPEPTEVRPPVGEDVSWVMAGRAGDRPVGRQPAVKEESLCPSAIFAGVCGLSAGVTRWVRSAGHARLVGRLGHRLRRPRAGYRRCLAGRWPSSRLVRVLLAIARGCTTWTRASPRWLRPSTQHGDESQPRDRTTGHGDQMASVHARCTIARHVPLSLARVGLLRVREARGLRRCGPARSGHVDRPPRLAATLHVRRSRDAHRAHGRAGARAHADRHLPGDRHPGRRGRLVVHGTAAAGDGRTRHLPVRAGGDHGTVSGIESISRASRWPGSPSSRSSCSRAAPRSMAPSRRSAPSPRRS